MQEWLTQFTKLNWNVRYHPTWWQGQFTNTSLWIPLHPNSLSRNNLYNNFFFHLHYNPKTHQKKERKEICAKNNTIIHSSIHSGSFVCKASKGCLCPCQPKRQKVDPRKEKKKNDSSLICMMQQKRTFKKNYRNKWRQNFKG